MISKQLTTRKLVTCEHGIGTGETCWWCESTKNKPTNERIDIMEQRFEALLGVIKLLLRQQVLRGGNVSVGEIIHQTIINQGGESLISSGLEADRPTDNSLAFWLSTDTDTIYQRRDDSWVDISFSRPTAPDVQVTDISIDDSTGALQITTP